MTKDTKEVLNEINKINKLLNKAIDKAMSRDNINLAKVYSTLQNHIDNFIPFVEKELN